MADVRPIRALHYDLAVAGELGDVAAPPYDVIDTELRAELLARSPYNAVAIDLPKPYGQSGPEGDEEDPYATAAATIEAWREAGALVDDPEPAIWAMTQDYTGPDGEARTRHGILCRVRVEDFDAGQVLPHERTLPGPKKDRLDLTRATRHNLSPIFSLSTRDAWPLVEAAIDPDSPWGEATDEGGTVTRLWRVGDPEVLERGDRAARRRPAADRRRPPPLRDRDRLPGRGRRRGRPQLHADGADRPRRPRAHRLPHPSPALGLRRGPRAPAAPRRGPARAVRRHRGRRRRARPARRGGGRGLRPLRLPPQAGLPAAAQGRRRSPRWTSSWRASRRPTAASTRRSWRPSC